MSNEELYFVTIINESINILVKHYNKKSVEDFVLCMKFIDYLEFRKFIISEILSKNLI